MLEAFPYQALKFIPDPDYDPNSPDIYRDRNYRDWEFVKL
jgi:hypothetical protein